MSNNELVLYIPASAERIPDDNRYENKFDIPSETSDNIYRIAQSKSGRWWSCECFGWRKHKHCKHLDELGIPGHYIPYEPKIIEQ